MTNEKAEASTKGPAQPCQPASQTVSQAPSPVKDFELEKAPEGRRSFANGDTDREDQK
jgi:hypothetical protein